MIKKHLISKTSEQ